MIEFDGTTYSAGGNAPSLTFEQGGHWSGSNSCGRLDGSYVLADGDLTFSTVTRTDEKCAPDDFDPTPLLGTPLSITVSSRNFTLRGGDEHTLLLRERN